LTSLYIVLDDLYRSKRIHIDNVTHYAFGQHEDGDFGIWIAGKAGWFSVTPSKQYKPIYREVEEAIDLHYFLVDRYNRKGKSKGKKSLSVDNLFEEVRGRLVPWRYERVLTSGSTSDIPMGDVQMPRMRLRCSTTTESSY
jgi:hypothetical protein